VINMSVAAAPACHSTLLQQRALKERAQIEKVAQQHAARHAIVPLQAEEPVGVERLAALAT